MSELVHEHIIHLVDAAGTPYDRALVYADPESDGTWRGFLEFVSTDGEQVVQTGDETTQVSLRDVADWAAGLEPVYIEGAFERALTAAGEIAAVPLDVDVAEIKSVPLTIEAADAEVPMRLMASSTLVPGFRRRVVDGAVLIYEASSVTATDEAGLYDFVAQVETDAAAEILADTLWSVLRDADVVLTVDGVNVPVRRTAIAEALLGAPVV
jgi:hypothetical protein